MNTPVRCAYPECGGGCAECQPRAQHTPGPWATAHVAEDTSLVSAGWYVFRVNNGWREWLSSSGSSSRFETEAQALAAIAKATDAWIDEGLTCDPAPSAKVAGGAS